MFCEQPSGDTTMKAEVDQADTRLENNDDDDAKVAVTTHVLLTTVVFNY